MTRKILFCSALETFFKGNEFMQRLGTHKENDPFGGEKGFLRVILWLCLILCCNSALYMCVCEWRRPYVKIDGQAQTVDRILSLHYPHDKKQRRPNSRITSYPITHIKSVCVWEWERGGGYGETHFCCSSFSWNISHEYWQQLCCRRQKEMNRGCWSQRQHTVWESLATVTARSTVRDYLYLRY